MMHIDEDQANQVIQRFLHAALDIAFVLYT